MVYLCSLCRLCVSHRSEEFAGIPLKSSSSGDTDQFGVQLIQRVVYFERMAGEVAIALRKLRKPTLIAKII
jgi:hypothetical protein